MAVTYAGAVKTTDWQVASAASVNPEALLSEKLPSLQIIYRYAIGLSPDAAHVTASKQIRSVDRTTIGEVESGMVAVFLNVSNIVGWVGVTVFLFVSVKQRSRPAA